MHWELCSDFAECHSVEIDGFLGAVGEKEEKSRNFLSALVALFNGRRGFILSVWGNVGGTDAERHFQALDVCSGPRQEPMRDP